MPSDYPFKHLGPVPPYRMIDRGDELRHLGIAAGEQTAIRIAAPRRYGKTTLLDAHRAALAGAGWVAAHVDLGGVSDLGGVARALISAWAPHRDLDPVRKARRLATRLGLEVNIPPVRLMLRAPPPSTDLTGLFEELLNLPEILARDVTGALVVFDEFQDLLAAAPQLDARVRAVIQHHQRTAYVFAGSEPSLLARMFERRDAPFWGQAEALRLGPLPVEDTIAEVERRFIELELAPGEAAAQLVEIGAGHPQRTMLLCHLLARQLREQPDLSDDERVEVVLTLALEETAEIHAAELASLSRQQRVVLGEIANGRSPLARDLPTRQAGTRGGYQDAAAALIADGHLLRRDPSVGWQIIDPLLALRLAR